jgi:heat shock protein HslJ
MDFPIIPTDKLWQLTLFGKYELRPSGTITLTAGATTLMICLGESIADEFLKTLGTIANYETRAGKHILSSGDGAKLTFSQ